MPITLFGTKVPSSGGLLRKKGQLVQHISGISLPHIINIKSVKMLKFPLDHILVQMFVHTTH